jgi:hypothetical protein
MTKHLRSPGKRIAVLASIPVALIASSTLVWQASYSAFKATDSTPTTNRPAGTFALSADSSAAKCSLTN